MKSAGSQTTGISDPTYNLISVAYHALQGAENYEHYAEDAQEEGEEELVDFFREAQQQLQRCADQAKQLLASRLQGVQTGMAAGQAAGTE